MAREHNPMAAQSEVGRTTPPGRQALVAALSGGLVQGVAVLALAILLLAAGILGAQWAFRDRDSSLSEALASAMPGLFPSPTPTATSTPTVDEQIAILMAEADQAWLAEDAQAALAELEKARALRPEDEQIRYRVFVAHSTLGLKLAEAARFEEARPHFELALALQPDNARVQEAAKLANNYATGAAHLKEGQRALAISHLEMVMQVNPEYHQTRALLHEAYFQEGLHQQEDGLLWRAKALYERAIAVLPGQELAEKQLALVDYMLATPTPTATYTPTATHTPTPSPTPTATPIPVKKILVDVSDQMFYAYENDTVKWAFVCSTGRASAPTRRGTFEVLDKIPNAWGGTWSIWMPNWLGIYWAGGTENGIHSLPVTLDGVEVWRNYLGTPISFGCIVLETSAAQLVYDWAEVGIPVIIRD